MGFTRRESRLRAERNCLVLCFPESITKRTPGTVREVSAMLVLIMSLRVRGGGGWKTRCCVNCGRAAKRGRICNLGMEWSFRMVVA
jgi:hypothetical protein